MRRNQKIWKTLSMLSFRQQNPRDMWIFINKDNIIGKIKNQGLKRSNDLAQVKGKGLKPRHFLVARGANIIDMGDMQREKMIIRKILIKFGRNRVCERILFIPWRASPSSLIYIDKYSFAFSLNEIHSSFSNSIGATLEDPLIFFCSKGAQISMVCSYGEELLPLHCLSISLHWHIRLQNQSINFLSASHTILAEVPFVTLLINLGDENFICAQDFLWNMMQGYFSSKSTRHSLGTIMIWGW